MIQTLRHITALEAALGSVALGGARRKQNGYLFMTTVTIMLCTTVA